MSATAWNPENVTDVAESVGISYLKPEVRNALSRDVEYRLAQVIEESLKFMKHSKRTVLWSQDIAQALRVLDVEPLYGYDSTRPLRYGEASIGPGQPLFYVEDEEVDFEKLINAPLPKVPREISFTGLSTVFYEAPCLIYRRALACAGRGTTVNTAESYLTRLAKPRALAKRPQRKSQPRGDEQYREYHHEATCEAYPVARTTAVL